MNEKVYDDILRVTTSTCESCANRESCPEDTCPLWQIEQICKEANKPKGTYQCFHCLSNSVVWQSDFDYEDYGLEGEGIVQVCHCSNCGADIEYYIPLGDNEE